jgi:hypothetical protein
MQARTLQRSPSERKLDHSLSSVETGLAELELRHTRTGPRLELYYT